jgi:hypothetical protein
MTTLNILHVEDDRSARLVTAEGLHVFIPKVYDAEIELTQWHNLDEIDWEAVAEFDLVISDNDLGSPIQGSEFLKEIHARGLGPQVALASSNVGDEAFDKKHQDAPFAMVKKADIFAALKDKDGDLGQRIQAAIEAKIQEKGGISPSASATEMAGKPERESPSAAAQRKDGWEQNKG